MCGIGMVWGWYGDDTGLVWKKHGWKMKYHAMLYTGCEEMQSKNTPGEDQGRVQDVLTALGHRRDGDVQISNMPRWLPVFHSQSDQKKWPSNVSFRSFPENSDGP